MIAGYENEKAIRNQYGVQIPICLIKTNKEIRHQIYQEMCNEGYKSPYEIRDGQEFWERYFDLHKKLFNEEHEVNICKSDKEVYELLCKRKYLATKESIEKSEYAVTLFDDPKNLVYRGIKFYPYCDAYGRLDKKSSYVKVYDIHPFIHDAYLETAFELDELDKIHSIINSVADEIFDLRHDKQ